VIDFGTIVWSPPDLLTAILDALSRNMEVLWETLAQSPSGHMITGGFTISTVCTQQLQYPLFVLRQVKKYPHTIFIIYFNNSRGITITSFFNIVPVFCNTLVPALQKHLDALRKKNVFG